LTPLWVFFLIPFSTFYYEAGVGTLMAGTSVSRKDRCICVPVANTHVGIAGKNGALAEQHGQGIRPILKKSDKDSCIPAQRFSTASFTA
jgi:hypothetical protein